MAAAHRGVNIGLLGAVLGLILAAILGVFLVLATDTSGDAVPRPLILAVLFATPGVIGLLGSLRGEPALLAAAAAPLFPGALLSFGGVTLPFLLAALLMLIGALQIRRADTLHRTLSGAVRATGIAALIVIGGWATLIGMTEPGCVPIPHGQYCSSAFISTRGVITGGLCLVIALVLAVWSAGVPKLRRWRC